MVVRAQEESMAVRLTMSKSKLSQLPVLVHRAGSCRTSRDYSVAALARVPTEHPFEAFLPASPPGN